MVQQATSIVTVRDGSRAAAVWPTPRLGDIPEATADVCANVAGRIFAGLTAAGEGGRVAAAVGVNSLWAIGQSAGDGILV